MGKRVPDFGNFLKVIVYPALKGSYERTLNIPELWSNSLDQEHAYRRGILNAAVFGLLAIFLAASIIQTIRTNPGNIPDDKEWDMVTDSMAESGGESEGFTSSDNGGTVTKNVE